MRAQMDWNVNRRRLGGTERTALRGFKSFKTFQSFKTFERNSVGQVSHTDG